MTIEKVLLFAVDTRPNISAPLRNARSNLTHRAASLLHSRPSVAKRRWGGWERVLAHNSLSALV
jgi:hypothetical protein